MESECLTAAHVNIIKALLSANTWTSGPDSPHPFSHRIQFHPTHLVFVCVCVWFKYSTRGSVCSSHLCSSKLSHPALHWAAWLCPSSPSDPSLNTSTLEGLRQLGWTGGSMQGNSLIMGRINDEKFGVIHCAPGYLSLGMAGLPIGASQHPADLGGWWPYWSVTALAAVSSWSPNGGALWGHPPWAGWILLNGY